MSKEVKDAEIVKTDSPADEEIKNFNVQVMSRSTDVMDPVAYAQSRTLAKDLMATRSLPTSYQNQEQVMMAITAGREAGMSPTEAIRSYYFVNGSLNIYGAATPAALRRNGWRIKYKDETTESCTAIVTNVKTGEVIEDTFTYQEAKDSGFVLDRGGRLKFGWKTGANRKRKLRYGVLSMIIHTYIPEVLGGAAGIGEYSQDYYDGQNIQLDESLPINSAAIEKLNNTKSLEELKEAYKSLSPAEQRDAEVKQLKDELKEKFSENS